MSTISNLSVQIIIFLTSAQINIFNAIDTTKDAATNETDFTFMVTGGYRPPKHTFAKYLVSVRQRSDYKYFGDSHFCGGCIIGPRIILTAAHCLTGDNGASLQPYTVRVVARTANRLLKTDDTLILDVRNIRIHPKFDPKNVSNDIAIAKLENDIDMDGRLAAIVPLANGPASSGTHCTVVGWGRILDNGPLAADAIYADIDINLKEKCSMYASFKEGQICGSKLEDHEIDSCSGDSGGPLICNLKLVGVVSYGYSCASGTPGVYSDVWFHREWIEENRSCSHAGSFFFTLFFASVVMVFNRIN